MKSTINILLAIAIAIATVAIPASAGNEGAEQSIRARRVSGTIIQIDRANRQLTIREDRTGAIIVAHVPPGTMVSLRASGNPAGYPRMVPFELIIQGLAVDLVISLTNETPHEPATL